MGSALLNLSRSVQELTEENQSLKEDLDRVLSTSPTISKTQGTFLKATAGGRPGKGGAWPLDRHHEDRCEPLSDANSHVRQHLPRTTRCPGDGAVNGSSQTSLEETVLWEGGRSWVRCVTGVSDGRAMEEGRRTHFGVRQVACAAASRVDGKVPPRQ